MALRMESEFSAVTSSPVSPDFIPEITVGVKSVAASTDGKDYGRHTELCFLGCKRLWPTSINKHCITIMIEDCQERGTGTLNTVSLTGPLQIFLSVALPGTLMKCQCVILRSFTVGMWEWVSFDSEEMGQCAEICFEKWS